MIWFAWRQLRLQAAVVYGVIAALLVALAVTGPRLADRAHTETFLKSIGGADSALYLIGVLAVLGLPFVIGMFWGAPLVTRELDAGTHRLAWTQTTRTRWLATKLALTGLVAMAAAGLLSLAVTWWSAPIDTAVARRDGAPGPGLLIFPRLSAEIFDSRGIVPLGYAGFAFVLGVTIGIAVRRTLPAMALLLAALAVTQITMSVAVRPHLMPPEHLTTAITAANLTSVGITGNLTVTVDRPGAWITGQQTVNAAGHAVTPPSWVVSCPGSSDQACFARLSRLGYRQSVSYQPANRFWPLQWQETAIYLALATLLAAHCTWWIRHRPS